MNIEEIAAVVDAALPMRPPTFAAGVGGATKARAIEDYMLGAAHTAAGLEEAHHWLSEVIERSADQIADITGYEAMLPHKPRDRITRDDIVAAKRVTDPAPFLAGTEAKRLRATVERQVERFKFEYTVLSRVYSVISGS